MPSGQPEMKTRRQYLCNALFPAAAVFIVGLIRMPKDCGQCVILLFVGSGLLCMFLLFLGLFYFLMNIKVYQKQTSLAWTSCEF